ncbi:hypothetical protein BO94DRAFT_609181, partial [Aspergillus sclerotioniger CBS 115572]
LLLEYDHLSQLPPPLIRKHKYRPAPTPNLLQPSLTNISSLHLPIFKPSHINNLNLIPNTMHLLQILAVLGATMTATQAFDCTPTQLHIGTIAGCGTNKRGPNWFAWFDNQSPCSGVDLGLVNSYNDNGLCNVTAQFPGRGQVAFGGCTKRPDTMSQAGPPTSVTLQDGYVLDCRAASEREIACPSPCDRRASIAVTSNYTCTEREML